jgi:uncharacterized protein YqhQ
VSRIEVGGQAVIEGVMMRSPSAFVVACRTSDGEVVVREDRWRSAWERLKFLRWPFLRGGVVLWETLQNGFSALTFSANLKMEDVQREEARLSPLRAPREPAAKPEPLGKGELARLIMSAVAVVLLVFVALPHLLTSLAGFRVETMSFHLVDGLIKLGILVAYVGGIALLPDIRRVYMYHGAEHKAIACYESGAEMTVANARGHSRFHPRCGTSFLLIVILISVLLFALALHRPLSSVRALDHALKLLIKIPLMLPVAGIAYEIIKLTGRWRAHPAVRVLTAPGMWLQRLTTREPSDDQIEVALTAVQRCLAREELGRRAATDVPLAAAASHP